MISVRVGLVLTFIVGCLYAAFGVFESLGKFALGLIVACVAVIIHGYLDYQQSDHDYRITREREQVWARRDGER
jgi:biopolymer transport protein ExbB/TolQ